MWPTQTQHRISLAENRTIDVRDFLASIDWESRGNRVETLAKRLENAHHHSKHMINCALNYGKDAKLEYFATDDKPHEETNANNVMSSNSQLTDIVVCRCSCWSRR